MLTESSLGFGLKPSTHGIQGSNHTSIDFPSPTKKQAPFKIRFLAFSIALQIRDAFLTGSFLSQLLLTLYLLHKLLMHRLSLLDATIQASLAIRAQLKSLDFLNLRPPHCLGRQSWSQAFHTRYLPFCFLRFHQNLLICASKFSQTFEGNSKVDIAYVDKACATDLIHVHLPAQERHLLLHPFNQASNLS